MTEQSPQDDATFREIADITESLVDGPFGSNLKSDHYVEQPGVRVVRLNNVHECRYDDTDRVFVSSEHARFLARHTVQPGDVLIAALGEDNNPVGRACCYPEHLAPAINKADCFRLRCRTDVAANRFVMYSLNSAAARAQVTRFEQGVTRRRINLGNFRRVQLWLPKLERQRRIAEILSTVDETIEQTKALIAKTQQIKTGLMHDLFTRGVNPDGRLRLPRDQAPELYKQSPLGWIPRDWDYLALADLVSPARPIVYGILMPGQGHPDGVPVVKVKDIVDGEIDTRDLLRTSPQIDSDYRRSRLREGDILLSIRGTVGRVAVVPTDLRDANITQDTARISIARGLPNYYRFYLCSPQPRRHFAENTIGVAVQGINLGDVRRTLVPVPPADEQAAVVASLAEAADQAVALQKQFAKLALLKIGLAHQLLPGRAERQLV